MTKNQQLQALINRYKQETGEKVVDMEMVADWAIRQGAIVSAQYIRNRQPSIRAASATPLFRIIFEIIVTQDPR